jgi:hypothetical protein
MPRQKVFDLTKEEWAEAHTVLNRMIQNTDEPQLKFFAKMAKAYRDQRNNARHRDIPWNFSYLTWLHVWHTSGRVLQRGLKQNGYVMARFNDEGDYATYNVEIITAGDNARQPQVLEKRRATINKRPADWKRADDYQHLRDRNNHPKSRPVVCPDGIVYPSAALAADTHKRTRVCIAQRCRTGWGGWHYADEKEKRVFKGKR